MSTRVVKRAATVLCAALLFVVAAVLPAAASESGVLYEEVKARAFDGAPDARYGARTAVYGDTFVVGAPGDSSQKGAVYVYTRTSPGWRFEGKLTASDGYAGDRFGASVAIWGDTIVVGAPGADTYAGLGAGKAYVFGRSGSSWTQRAKLMASGPTEHAQFGWAVDVYRDTAAVSEYWGDTPSAPDAGRVHIFTRSGDAWSHRQVLVSPVPMTYEFFGYDVAISGERLVVAAYAATTPAGPSAGACYVFVRTGVSWVLRQQLTASDGAAGDFFGASVAMDRDTIVVGAWYKDAGRGAAYVFEKAAGSETWPQAAKLTVATPGPGDYFGGSVSISGDAIVVGALGTDTVRGPDTGAAHVYLRGDGVWPHKLALTASDGAGGDEYGCSVAISGGNVLVGASADDTVDGANAGGAYSYSFRTELYPGLARIAGFDRYQTALEASRRGFPVGAPTVVIATGANWPDALGGSALAGAAHGPLLLTRPDMLGSALGAEIRRLGATKAYIVGSTAAVSSAVEDALTSLLGSDRVVRLGGANRYQTAQLVAQEAIRLRGAAYLGLGFIATGLNYPDATAVSPLAAWQGTPVILADPRAGSVALPTGMTNVYVLGSEAAVPKRIYDDLVSRLGATNVHRVGGANRYDTAARIAALGAASSLTWNGIGLATGTNFPDALAAGPMLASNKGLLLLTRPDVLPAEPKAALLAHEAIIDGMFIFGDLRAVSREVEEEARMAAGL